MLNIYIINIPKIKFMIKKVTTCLFIATALMACNNSEKTTENNTKDSITSETSATNTAASDTATFDINSIAISDKELGTFPYLSYPDGYNFNYEKENSAKNIKALDIEYFAVNGKLVPVEGKSYKVRIEKDANSDNKFNKLVVERYYEDKISSLGGVKVNNIPVPSTELKRVGDKELVDKQYGHSIDYNLLDDIKTYVIRTTTKQIWIQMTLMNNEVGKLTVLEKEVNNR